METVSGKPVISLLLAMRKNSKFFAKFLAGFLLNTHDFSNVELIIMASEEDTWNKDLFELYKDRFTVYYENLKVGKNGRHFFYNELAQKATGDWLWHMCDDHYLLKDYDLALVDWINSRELKSSRVNLIVPRVENSGSIAHLLSRGWYSATGRMGYHGNIDSYLNNLSELLPEHVLHYPPQPVLWDYTTDPSIMTPEHTKTELDPTIQVYDLKDPFTENKIREDLACLQEAIRNEA